MGYIYWIGLAQDRDKWKTLVNAVMNLRGSKICWEVLGWLYNWWPLEQLSSIKLVSYKTHRFTSQEKSMKMFLFGIQISIP
jgi:hypothetical protein